MTRSSHPARSAAFFRSGTALLALLAASPALAAETADAAADTSGAEADAAGTAAALDAEAGPAIVVTARRREESSQDVPIALSVVSSQTLDRTGNFTLNQVQQLVPSLQITSSNPRNSNINIRGLGANSAVAVDGLEYGVGFYVDGVYYGRPGQSQFDLIDLQQIEVLRGPQGTLFGKNTTAGAINITTREPSFTPELTIEGSAGNYEYRQLRGSGSIPLIEDKLAVRISGALTHRDGFLHNLYDGGEGQDYTNRSVRGQVLIKPTEDLKIRLIGDYSSQKSGVILNVIDGYFTKYANGATIANSFIDRAARTGYVLPTTDAFSREGNSNSPYGSRMKSYGVSGQVDWDLGAATLTSVTAYRWWDWFPRNDVDGTPLSVTLKAQQANFQRQFTQELRLASDGKNTIDYVAGLFYLWQRNRGYGETQQGADYVAWNVNPATAPAGLIPTLNQALTGLQVNHYSDPQTKSYAAFGQVDWHVSPALTLTGGLRYTHEEKEGRFERFLAPDSGGNRALLTPAQQASYQVSNLAFAAQDKADAVSGLATVSYKVAPEVLVYGTYSRGAKSGGLNLTAGGIGKPVVDPEKVTAYEVGFKSQFLDNRVTFNAAAFLTQIKDYQTNVVDFAGTPAQVTYIANIPKVRSKGVEADLSFAPTRWLSFTASAAYTDAKFVSFANSPQAPENANNGVIQDLSGRRLPGVSKLAYSISADVTQPVGDEQEIYARADWAYRTAFNSTATLSQYGRVPAYGLLNVRLGARTADQGLDFSVWVRNLLDKDYYQGLSPNALGLINGTTGDPRTFGATVRAAF